MITNDYDYDYDYTKSVITITITIVINPKPVNPYLGQQFTRLPFPSTSLGMRLIMYTIIIYVK